MGTLSFIICFYFGGIVNFILSTPFKPGVYSATMASVFTAMLLFFLIGKSGKK